MLKNKENEYTLAEKILLGSVILGTAQISSVAELLNSEKYFSDSANQLVYAELLNMQKNSIDINGISVIEQMTRGTTDTEIFRKVEKYIFELISFGTAYNYGDVEVHAIALLDKYNKAQQEIA